MEMYRCARVLSWIWLLGLGGLPGTSHCQVIIFDVAAPALDTLFGDAVADIGDINQDHAPDIVVGERLAADPFFAAGGVWVLSGRDGTAIHHIVGDSPGMQLGTAVARAGDMDADGIDDVLVGSMLKLARVYSGATGMLRMQVPAPFDSSGAFGGTVSGIGDLDGDSYADLVIGDRNYGGVGRVHVYSGRTGSALWTRVAAAGATGFGAAMAAIGDLNLDGTPDLLVGAPKNGQSGSAHVLSGKDGSELLRLDGSGGSFGYVVAHAGDVDFDGRPDLLIGAPKEGGSGHVVLHSGKTGAILKDLFSGEFNDGFGRAVAGGRDLDRDGAVELLVGAPFHSGSKTQQGRLYVVDASDGAVQAVIDGGSPGRMSGSAVAAVADVNADGFHEVLVGSPFGGDGAGAVALWTFGDPPVEVYGAPCSAAVWPGGTLTLSGDPLPGATVTLKSTLVNLFGLPVLLFGGSARAEIPTSIGCPLLVGSSPLLLAAIVQPTPVEWVTTVPVGLTGTTVTLQMVTAYSSAQGATTNGVEIQFQ